MERARFLAAVAGVLATAVLAAPASAFTAPELFVRMQPWTTHEPASDWIPLAAAPSVDYLGGYEIGYRLQASGEPNEFQRVALTVAGVPDGGPTQPRAAEPYCVGRAGAVGTIVAAGPELQFEGNGTYTVRVSIGPGSGGAAGCLTGPSTTASFGVGVQVAPALAGTPLSFRAMPLPGNPFVGVRATDPPGGQADVRCALDGTVAPDGSVAGAIVVPGEGYSLPAVVEDAFPRPGAWTCVARGTAEGEDEDLDTTVFATPWSDPLRIEVRSDFRRRTGAIARPRSRRPRFTFKAEWPDAAAGGRGNGDAVPRHRLQGRALEAAQARALRRALRRQAHARRHRRPRAAGHYLGRFAFSGTRFLRAGVDPNPVLLVALRDRIQFATPREFPSCAR